MQINIVLEHCIPRLCNGSTSDSGSDCGGSNPPWGTITRLSGKIITVDRFFGSHNLCGKPRFFWPLRITASTADSHSVNRSSILLGAINCFLEQRYFPALLFYFKTITENRTAERAVAGLRAVARQFCN